MSVFKKAADGARQAGGDLDKFARWTNTGMAKWLNPGVHEVAISGVDPSQVHQGYCHLVYKDKWGSEFSNNMFVSNKEKTDISIWLAKLMESLWSDTEAYSKFLDAVDADYKAFGMLVGMKLKIVLGRSPGYYLKKIDEGNYVALDAKTGEEVEGLSGDDAKALHARAKESGYKRSWPEIVRYEGYATDENIRALDNAINGKGASAPVRAVL